MTSQDLHIWVEANQRHLVASLNEVRLLLKRHAARLGADACTEGEAVDAVAQDTPDMSPPSALDTLCRLFQLSDFERKVLLSCAGVELDGSFATLCAQAQGDPRRSYPTFSLALAALPEAHWSALTPTAPLRYWRLVDIGSGASLATSPLRIDERILHYLAGVSDLDERLMGVVEAPRQPAPLVGSHAGVAQGIVRALVKVTKREGFPVVHLVGKEPTDIHDVAATAAGAMGLRLYLVRCASLPNPGRELDDFIRLWDREAALNSAALLLECGDLTPQGPAYYQVIKVADGLGSVVMIGSGEKMPTARRSTTFEVGKPAPAEQLSLWQEQMPGGAVAADTLRRLVSQFSLGSGVIRQVAGTLDFCACEKDDGSALWESCRLIARPRLDNLAQRIEPAAGWDDIVLPAQQTQILREISLHVRLRDQVYENWGFAAGCSRGLGISALFEGVSGTGKTMAAEVLANELRLDLYRIDLSQVVSKYIGETEKNLRQVFDAADSGGAILLFDEADALFGKRSEIRDSHDRYANIEVSYLLQRMEEYRGLAILTTNLKSALDTAFLRRIRFVAHFPFPDSFYRAEIWRRVFPKLTPTAGIDVEKLARLNVAGGNIRNIALNAAFLAAGSGGAVGMAHLLQAARGEYAKLEKPLSAAEIGGWV